MEVIKLALADDHELVRIGLKSLIADIPGFSVVGETGELGAVHAMLEESQPDVLLLDIQFPEKDSYDECRLFKRLYPKLKIIFLTSSTNKRSVFRAIESGSDGYLLKQIDSRQMADIIRDVYSGKSFLDPSITQTVFRQLKREDTPPLFESSHVEALTPQEVRVFRMVAEGHTNNEIAEAMNLSPKTVKNYLSRGMEKAGLKRRAQAAVFYVQHLKDA